MFLRAGSFKERVSSQVVPQRTHAAPHDIRSTWASLPRGTVEKCSRPRLPAPLECDAPFAAAWMSDRARNVSSPPRLALTARHLFAGNCGPGPVVRRAGSLGQL